MGNYDQVLSLLMEVVSGAGKAEKETRSIPLGISNRHVHLSQADVETLFGAGYTLSKCVICPNLVSMHVMRPLRSAVPRGHRKVRVLGPVRKQSQVEIMRETVLSWA